jgi:hypothetical protein
VGRLYINEIFWRKTRENEKSSPLALLSDALGYAVREAFVG